MPTSFCLGFVATGNAYSQLADGTTIGRNAPVSAAAAGSYIEWAEASAGFAHTCVVFNDGALNCWGKNDNGEVGVGTTSDVSTYTTVAGAWARVSGGSTHTCAVYTNSSAACWGSKTNIATTTSPKLLDDAGPWSFFAQGYNDAHVCAVKTDGSLYCWCVSGREDRLGTPLLAIHWPGA